MVSGSEGGSDSSGVFEFEMYPWLSLSFKEGSSWCRTGPILKIKMMKDLAFLLGSIFRRVSVPLHCYADDSQIYLL